MTTLTAQLGCTRRPGRGLQYMAMVAACAVFPLIFVGAGVTTIEVGMAYPDGFTSDGHFLTNPPGWWDAVPTRWEHGHRLLGRTVGILAIVLAVWCWRYGGLIRKIGVANLAAICVQGVLGALRVNEISTTLAMIHGIFGQLCFCLSCTVAMVTSPFWVESRIYPVREGDSLKRLCWAAAVVVFVQLALGAAYRHFESAPLLVAHVFWAMVVTFAIGWMAAWIPGHKMTDATLIRLGQALAALMVVQLLLGGAAFVVSVMGGMASSSAMWAVPTLHVAVGALLLANAILLSLYVHRVVRPVLGGRTSPEGAAVTSV